MPRSVRLDKSNKQRGWERRRRRAVTPDALLAQQTAEASKVQARSQAALERAAKAELRLRLAKGKSQTVEPVAGHKRFVRIIE